MWFYSCGMRSLSLGLEDARGLFLRQSAEFIDACGKLDDFEMLEASRCRGWSRLEVIEHVRDGLAQMGAAAAAFTDEPPDHDAATYWASHPDDRDADPIAHVMWLRRTASAYRRPTTALYRLQVEAETLATVVAHVPDRTVLFQGKAMSTGDFIATWVVELAIHQVDLSTTADTPVGLPLARRTIEAVADADLPADVPLTEAVLAGLGRIPAPHGVNLSAAFPMAL